MNDPFYYRAKELLDQGFYYKICTDGIYGVSTEWLYMDIYFRNEKIKQATIHYADQDHYNARFVSSVMNYLVEHFVKSKTV